MTDVNVRIPGYSMWMVVNSEFPDMQPSEGSSLKCMRQSKFSCLRAKRV